MPDISASEIPRPLNWQDFQRSSVILFRCVLRDDQLQEFGREGQTQHGIDLLGYRNADLGRPVGIQCRRIKKGLTTEKMRSDVEEARGIKPALAEFIFATTAERDKALQLAAAEFTQELIASGWNCRVSVMAWQDLQHEISQHPPALRAFWPSGTAIQEPVIEAVKEGTETVTALLREMNEKLGQSRQIVSEEYDVDLAPEARNEPLGLHTRISTLRELIGKGKTKTALEGFEKLLAQDPPLPPYARYRVIANIGAVHFNAGRNDLALKYSTEALSLRPEDHKAQTNLAYAEVVGGNMKGGRARAQAVLEKHPEHAPAASLIIQSYAQDDTVADPFAVIPKESRDTVEVKVATIMFLRAHENKEWEALAQRATAEHPGNRHLERFSAEAVLEPALADAEIQLGKPAPEGLFNQVQKSAETLEKLWKQEMDAENPHPHEAVPMANNAAAALRFVGQTKRAARVLDDTIEKIGRDPGIVRARALLHLASDEDKSAAILLETIGDAEGILFLAQLSATKDPAGAREKLEKLDVAQLPEHMRILVPEIRGEIALAENDPDGLQGAIEKLKAEGAPFATISVLRARAQEKGLIKPEVEADEEADASSNPAIAAILHDLPAHEDQLSYADRVQLAQYLERHDADETASNLLDGQVSLDRDSVAVRTYLSSSIGAHLFARAKKVIETLPRELFELPAYQRMAASYYWNIGDAKAAEPFIKRLREASPERLDLLLWHIDALIRLNAEDKVRQLLKVEVETKVDGALSAKRRLVAALSTYGQLDRARAFAYRILALNRDDPVAWTAFMSTMFTGETSGERDHILSTIITPDHAVEVRLPSGESRRYVIESDQEVRRVSEDAIAPEHEIARVVQGLKPSDPFDWPGTGGRATIVTSKHKYLDAFHTALGRFNERFPSATGFKQVSVGTPEQFDTSAIEEMLKSRSDHIAAETAKYVEGRISLSMLAYLTGVDPIDCMLGLSELGKVYRVSIGSREERRSAAAAIAENQARGCVVDASTYHCIRRLGAESIVSAVCGPIGISQATADIYHARVASLDAFGGKKSGSMAMRDGRIAIVEYTDENLAATRAVVEGDRNWLVANTETLPAAPIADPPPIIRRLSAVEDARFFDDAYAASGSSRLLLSDDLFTRQVAAQLGTQAVSLQPILMRARQLGLMSPTEYAKTITDLIEFGQQSIAIDAATLLAARKLDMDNGDMGAGPRFRTAARALGGVQCDPDSHCSVTAEFIEHAWSMDPLDLQPYPAISHVLLAVLRQRTNDYPKMLDRLDFLLRDNVAARQYLRGWARGHFLKWPQEK